jgi:hypothetical protein
MINTIISELGFGKLVLKACCNDTVNPEYAISLESDEGVRQDICLVRKSEEKDKTIECLLWTDKEDELYTHKYEIGMRD